MMNTIIEYENLLTTNKTNYLLVHEYDNIIFIFKE